MDCNILGRAEHTFGVVYLFCFVEVFVCLVGWFRSFFVFCLFVSLFSRQGFFVYPLAALELAL